MTFPTFSAGEVLTAADQNAIVSYLSPTGSVTAFAGSTAPTNWLLCNGTTVSRTTYAALFAVCGTTYNTGGEAGTDFRLPNLLGRVPVGRDAGQTEFDTLGETGGAKTVSLTEAQMPAHSHTVTDSGGFTPSAINISVGGGGQGFYGRGASQVLFTDSKGSGTAHNNLQPYLVLNYIIKT
jgi:microcystin-dependent protein